jgi:hypothetical protein
MVVLRVSLSVSLFDWSWFTSLRTSVSQQFGLYGALCDRGITVFLLHLLLCLQSFIFAVRMLSITVFVPLKNHKKSHL